MILIVNISWIITGTKKRCRFVATPPYIVLTDLSISYHYNDHIAPGNTASALCRLSVQVQLCSLNISWFFFVCGCKCRDFFLISNTSRQLFSWLKTLISKDIKFFLEAPFSRVKYRYNDSFIIIIFTENLNSRICGKITNFRVKVSKPQTQLTFM